MNNPEQHRVHTNLNEKTYSEVRKIAESERRSLSAQIAVVIEQYMRDLRNEGTA